MRHNAAVASVIALAPLLAGCLPENLGDGLTVINDTDRKLWFSTIPIPPGESWRYETTDCSDSDLSVLTADHKPYATLTEHWCAGQIWTITGPDQGTLSRRQ